MDKLIPYLPLLNLPAIWALLRLYNKVVTLYVKNEVRLVKLEQHQLRVEDHLGWERRHSP